MLLDPATLQGVIETYGITHDTMVIVYNGEKSYIGGAYRVAWALMYAGVEDVRYLNGDLDLWRESGGAIETTTNHPVPVDDFGVTVPVHPEYYASIEDIRQMVDDPTAVIGDDRSWIDTRMTRFRQNRSNPTFKPPTRHNNPMTTPIGDYILPAGR